MESRESVIPHTSYRCEKNMLEAVRMGDYALAAECMHILDSSGKAGTLSSNPLRQEQIIFISHITIITRAAMDAHVPEDLAFAMSDSYIRNSEKCTDIAQILALRQRALKDFTEAVKHRKNSPPFSKATRNAVTYMNSHIQEKISLQTLARISGLSQSRFSHLFREETGDTPMAYLQKERIKTAQTMLLYTDYSVSEISNILCFSSESHFIQVFRKITGTSPGKYRKTGNPSSELPV